MPVRLVNRTGKTVPFSACDSRLYLVLQALDRDGTWRNLEAFPNIHCGNSHHRVFLETDQYWEVFAFLHDGEFPTKLRFCLEPQRNAMNGEQADTIYSNEFAGAVDPSAFLRLTRH